MQLRGRDLALSGWLHRLRVYEASLQAVPVALALGGAMWWCWSSGHMPWLVPLFLGVIASALAETDDNWRGRLRTLVITLCGFALVSFSIEAVVQSPLLFALALCGFTLALTMLGAVGEGYRAVSTASVILALYTAMSVGATRQPPSQSQPEAHLVPVLLLTGAAWYGLLSVLWKMAFALRPLRIGLAQLYAELSGYLQLKASLFEPVRGVDVQQRRIGLAQANGRVVAVLNVMKERLLSRMQAGRAPQGELLRCLNLYFLAQDIHERASSSHYLYNDWADELFHSDVLYRCQRVLALQGVTCARLAEALRAHEAFTRGVEVAQAIADLDAAITYLEQQNRAHWLRPLHSLRALSRNLTTLDAQLTLATGPLDTAWLGDVTLFDASARTLGDAWSRITRQFHWRSPLLRHAVRLSAALAAGCLAMQMTDPEHGHWILLTTLFVCQATYGATITRVFERIIGTVLGLLVGWALLKLFPGLATQALIAVGAGVVFFITRNQRYVIGTAAITLMVLMCFNQTTGAAYELIAPRLIDTLVGSVISAVAMLLVLPDWQGRRLNVAAANAVAANAAYLREILSQYAQGKDDDLDYRVARRNAHDADAALSNSFNQLMQEPYWARRNVRWGQRVLVRSHSLLNYVSALGAHRGKLGGAAQDAVLLSSGELAVNAFNTIASALRAHGMFETALADDAGCEAVISTLEDHAESAPGLLRVQLNQLALICRQIAPLRQVTAELALASDGAK
ncbi:YccS family putative transporter [Diaphorobacter aerolatus]|uniref:TIGR01666 family membrane protein n=1 Tax=Diaphorobacter aerolatus TaxID=1288495 RepID=A0A7H0GMJ5_9BURK|nr:YccS family putative transporter [Diaphorobacter aerolatus]QNP49511.1 TIGR01666 family membrane protein [Diaphorobacter aerolatus]